MVVHGGFYYRSITDLYDVAPPIDDDSWLDRWVMESAQALEVPCNAQRLVTIDEWENEMNDLEDDSGTVTDDDSDSGISVSSDSNTNDSSSAGNLVSASYIINCPPGQSWENYLTSVRDRRMEQRFSNPNAIVDYLGSPPPSEDASLFYVVLYGWRNVEAETIELAYVLANLFGTIGDFSHVVLPIDVAVYVGYTDLPTSVYAAVTFPRGVAGRVISPRIANTYFVDF